MPKIESFRDLLVWQKSHASGAELQTQLIVGRRINVVSEADAAVLIADAGGVGRMLHGLVRSLERAR